MSTKSFIKIAIVVIFTSIFSYSTFAQTPQMFKYQAVLRDAGGNILTGNHNITVRIYDAIGASSPVWAETHTGVPTTAQGIINLNIGSVTSLEDMNWSTGNYFIGITIDAGTELGRSQLLAVPYALYSKTAEKLSGNITSEMIENNTITMADVDPTSVQARINGSAANGQYITAIDEFGTLTTSNTGLMSSTDKTKLDGLQNADGSETKITAGTNVTITGTGTVNSPYVFNAIPKMTQTERDALTRVEGLIIYNTTTHLPNYYNGTWWMNYDGTIAETLFVGMACQGGIVAYILKPGDTGYNPVIQHGIIAAPSDQLMSNYGDQFTLVNAQGSAIGTGAQNTIDIESGDISIDIAADRCTKLVLNGYSDWFLPSIDELNILYINRSLIGGFSTNNYWSSTEGSMANAWVQSFLDGSKTSVNKGLAHRVRAVRSF